MSSLITGDQTQSGTWVITYSNEGISPSNLTFYYDTQLVYLLSAHGPLVNFSVGAIDAQNWSSVAQSINFGAQAGGCLVMFFVVLALSQPAKRRTPVFILNVLSVFFGFLRGLFFALFFISPWNDVYPYYTGDYTSIPTGAYALSILGSITPVLMTTAVNLSLVFQVHTVCKSMADRYRYSIIIISGLVFFVTVGFELTEVVTNCLAIVNAQAYYNAQTIQKGNLYTETLSIWWFSIVFTSKLVYTLYYRRKNGWKQWSSVKILAAMGGCTMVVPSIFAILQYVNYEVAASFPQAGTLGLALVALLLPLSSLWAGMVIDDESAILNISYLSGNNMQIPDTTPSPRSKGSGNTILSSTREDYMNDRKGSFKEIHRSTIDSKVESGASPYAPGRDSTEMDLEAMGFRIDKSYSAQSGKGQSA